MPKQIKNICFLGCILVACGLSLASRASAATTQDAAAKKDWTMLVYLNGNNNLDDFGAMNIKQMQQIGSTDQLNVVVQWASMAANDTKRLLIAKDPTATTVTSPVVQSLPVVDMGDKNTLMDFIRWGTATYPADHYFLVVWDHGAGWHYQAMNAGGSHVKKAMRPNDISFDERSGNHITTEELASTVDQMAALIGHKVDIYGSDACLMAMVEVAQQMGNSVGTFVGSEETEPGDGWPYDLFMKSWTDNPTATPNQIGKYLVDAYQTYYKNNGTTTATFSALDMSKLPALVDSITQLKDSLLKSNLSVVKTAAGNSARYTYPDYVDLTDVVSNIRTALDKSDVAQLSLDAVSLQIKNAIVASATTGTTANGISIWWPQDSSDWSAYGIRYQALKFDQITHWDELLQKMF